MEKPKIVYQNIEESPFSLKYEEFEFFFSSQFYKRNFKKRVDSYILEETYKIKNRYKIKNEKFVAILKEVLLIALYKKIEMRGFRIYKSGERYIED
jgi:hypothetical protein